MGISIIAAVSSNNVIGKDNQLAWHLPADLKHFKELTMGHHILMGRKTFESVGRALPGRTTVIITRDQQYSAEMCKVANSLDSAIDLSDQDEETFICGGGEIYKQALDKADTIHLTRIHQEVTGDTHFPEIDEANWELKEQVDYQPDEKNSMAYSFITYKRR